MILFAIKLYNDTILRFDLCKRILFWQRKLLSCVGDWFLQKFNQKYGRDEQRICYCCYQCYMLQSKNGGALCGEEQEGRKDAWRCKIKMVMMVVEIIMVVIWIISMVESSKDARRCKIKIEMQFIVRRYIQLCKSYQRCETILPVWFLYLWLLLCKSQSWSFFICFTNLD